MFKKLAYAVIAGSLLIAPFAASATSDADSPFPSSESLDYGIHVAGSDTNGPFPSSESLDYGIHIAMPDADGPFPKGDGADSGLRITV